MLQIPRLKHADNRSNIEKLIEQNPPSQMGMLWKGTKSSLSAKGLADESLPREKR